MAASIPIYQLKISLVGSKPPIWRRVLVSSAIKLSKLHFLIQGVFDWDNSHLHSFTHEGIEYALPMKADLNFGLDFDTEDERKVELRALLKEEKQKLEYLYDFGDSWQHSILLEKILPREKGEQYPKVVAGKCGAPPEDSGGIWGYYVMLEALESPEHPDHDMYAEWIEEGFEPETFDLEATQQRLNAFMEWA